MTFPIDRLPEFTLLQAIWGISILLLALALTTMFGLIIRRLLQNRRDRRRERRKKALTQLAMIFMDGNADDASIRAMCKGSDLKIILDVATSVFEGRSSRKQLREDLELLRDIVRDLLGSVRGASSDHVINLLRKTPMQSICLADLKRRDVGARVNAIETLALLPGPEVINALGDVLDDRSPDVRLAAARALAEMGEYVTVHELVIKLDIGESIRSRMLRDIFRSLATHKVSDLVQLLERKPGNLVTALAIYAIGTTQDFSMIPVITRYADWPSIDVRTECMRALAAIGHPAAEETVIKGLQDESWEVRTEAAICAGVIPLPNAVPILRERLADIEWWPRYRAAEALRAIGGNGRAALEDARRGTGSAARISDMILTESSAAA